MDVVDSAAMLNAPPPGSAMNGDFIQKEDAGEVHAMHEALRKIANEVGI